jgi:hypothetical protein
MSDQYPQYPSYPTGPTEQGSAPAAVPQPSSIATAVKLMYAGAALSLVSLIIGLVSLGGLKDEIADSVRETDPQATQSVIDAAYAASLGFIFVMGLVGIVLWLWMAWKNGQGRSWARVTATVLGVLNALMMLLSLTQPGATAVSIGSGLLSLVLAVAILVFLWKSESSRYYEAVSRSRQLH